ncbi:MAG: S-methyl-5-thioribose-1-phosphate isomerase [Chitinispirillales bacterium]|nr:S-methyl-5-thioribose-1-phosphate isomerase [Chitinispirillales bacterium]
MTRLKTIEWNSGSGCVRMIDQTLLPERILYLDITTIEQMHEAIKILRVRGAPAIGIAAAFGLYLGVRVFPDSAGRGEFLAHMENRADYLAGARPTAVNLFWALDRMKKAAHEYTGAQDAAAVKKRLFDEACLILEEDRKMCRAIGEAGFELLGDKRRVLTHCNAGGLAASEFGTALAPVYVGQEKGAKFKVFADETRPLLQGARITALELSEAGIDVTVICDNMAATVMVSGSVEACIVGADRIAANGDTANKIGTYGVALIAAAHGIPFYVAAPSSTFDLTIPDGSHIPIEERGREEVAVWGSKKTVPDGVSVFNPSFDVTPNILISAIITEKGVIEPPFTENINSILSSTK